MRTRSLASILVIVAMAPAFAGCGSDKKTTNPSGSVWAGKTYLLNIPETRWKKPKGDAGKEFGKFVPKFIFNVENAASGVNVLLGSSDATGNQDSCTPTVEIQAADPQKQIGPTTARLHVANDKGSETVAPVYNLTLTNILSETPEAVGQTGQFNALLDVNDAYQLFYQLDNPTPTTICDTLGSRYESPCVACPSGSMTCLELQAVGLVAAPLTGVSVQPIDNATDDSCTRINTGDAGT